MKWVFTIIGAAAFLLYLLAVGTLQHGDPDKAHLRWATDPNPARIIQTGLFTGGRDDVEMSVEAGAMEKLLVQCATGTGPDIIDIYSVQQMAGYVQAGLLMDLTPYAGAMGFGPSSTYPSLRDGLFVENKQYRFPCNVAVNAVIYNRDIFDDHGIPYPEPDWTYEDFIEIGKRFKEPGKSGISHLPVAHYAASVMFNDLFAGIGGRYYRDGGLQSDLDSPEAIRTMELYRDMIHVHGVIPTPEIATSMSAQGGWGSGGITWFSNERAAMILIGRWYLVMLHNYPGIADKIGAVPLPRYQDQPSRGYIDCRGAGINAQTEHKDEALAFLQYLARPAYNEQIIKDGDSLPPNPAYAQSGDMLSNKIKPDADFHQVFLDAAARARPMDISPFIDAMQAQRWLEERISRVENNPDIDVPELMRDLAREINLRIRRNLERNRYLQRMFEDVTGTPYTADGSLIDSAAGSASPADP